MLVSEVMLQQTQAGRVVPVFERFLAGFPTVEALSLAPRAEVVRAWDGLGYNRRAIALANTARELVSENAGQVPRDPAALRRLPGVGQYTAAAVASIGFGLPVAAVDTNVRRVVARVHTGADAGETDPALVRDLADRWLDRAAPGEWNQALMDLGREVCRPRPQCDACPLASACRFRGKGTTPRAARARQVPYEGSSRQVRGAVVRALRRRESASLGALCAETGFDALRVRDAVHDLRRDGLVEAGPAAVAGRPGGRVRLAR